MCMASESVYAEDGDQEDVPVCAVEELRHGIRKSSFQQQLQSGVDDLSLFPEFHFVVRNNNTKRSSVWQMIQSGVFHIWFSNSFRQATVQRADMSMGSRNFTGNLQLWD